MISHHRLREFYDTDRLASIADRVLDSNTPTVLIGWGAALVPIRRSTLVLADLARWEIQQRQRRGAPNWRCHNGGEDNLRKVKRGFFVEWRVADRHKRELFAAMDFVLDTNRSAADGKLITAETFRAGMAAAVSSPFRVVPFFDPGVWGGQWMKQVCGLDDETENYAWCFDCVPRGEQPAARCRRRARRAAVHRRGLHPSPRAARPADLRPVRRRVPDQVRLPRHHGGRQPLAPGPSLTDYIHDTFGMPYTQDESYYLLDAADDAVVFLGLKTGIDPDAMVTSLGSASRGELSFPAAEFINAFPAKKHDHFDPRRDGALLRRRLDGPGDLGHLLTFKMWDWDRVGLDGVPRPIHLEHARRNIQWERDTAWTRDNLVGQVETLCSGPGWVEERTGLHSLEFIEVRRHWFTEVVEHDTAGTRQRAQPGGRRGGRAGEPDQQLCAVRRALCRDLHRSRPGGRYRIRPHGAGVGTRLATIKAFVRGTDLRTAG